MLPPSGSLDDAGFFPEEDWSRSEESVEEEQHDKSRRLSGEPPPVLLLWARQGDRDEGRRDKSGRLSGEPPPGYLSWAVQGDGANTSDTVEHGYSSDDEAEHRLVPVIPSRMTKSCRLQI